jgi:iron complex outermembrane recepter protein
MKKVLFIFLLLTTFKSIAQKPLISGRVIRAESNEVLIGASVSIKGTTRGTITDANGQFQLRSSVNVGDVVLVAKFIGFKDQEMTVKMSGVNKTIVFSLVSNDSQLDDVVVTANKTEEFLQQVSVAATVVSSRDMEQRSSYSTLDAMKDAPLLITDSWVTSQTSFSIRGLSNNFDNVGFETTVGLYLDDVYYSRPFVFNSTLFDLERIEILRGPQGTLFGKNTVGGVIHLVSEKPEFANNGQIELVGGNYGYFQARGKINQTLIKDKLSFRLTGALTQRNGYIPDPNKAVMDESKTAFNGMRGSLFYKPNDKLNLEWKAFYGRDNHTEQTMIYLSKPDDDPLGVPAADYKTNKMNTPQPFTRNQYGSSLKLNYHIKENTLTSVTAYNSSEDFTGQDWDNTALNVATWGRTQGVKSFSQELRLASPRDKKLAFITGLYFQKEKIKGRDTSTINSDFIPFAEKLLDKKLPRISNFEESYAVNSTINTASAAAFGSVSYTINDKLKLNVGGRFTHETREFSFYQNINYFNYQGKPLRLMDIYATKVASAAAPLVRNTNDNVLTGDFSMDYKVSPYTMSYVKFTRGFKGAGFNTSVTTYDDGNSLVFAPEFVNSIETGMKSKFSNRLRLNAALFYTDYINKQEFLDEGTTVTIVNVDKAGGWGGEVEGSAMFGNLKLDVSGGFLNMKYQDFIFGTDEDGKPIDFSGNRLLKAPTMSLAVSPTYTLNVIDKYKIFLGLNVNYTGKSYNDISNSEIIARRPVTLINSRIALSPKNGKWSIALWGKNLGNQIYYQHGWEYDWGDQVSIGRPRTYGIEMYLNFF